MLSLLPAAAFCQTNVATVSELVDALADDSATRIVLVPGTYNVSNLTCTACSNVTGRGYQCATEYNPSALCINRTLTMEASEAGTVVLDAQKVLDSGSFRRVFYITGLGVELIGLNITGGVGSAGGGLLIDGEASLTDCNIYENRARLVHGGGGIYIRGAATLTRCNVMYNEALSNGGGLRVDGNATLISSNIDNNTAEYGHGGGMRVDGFISYDDQCSIAGNVAEDGMGNENYFYPTSDWSTIQDPRYKVMTNRVGDPLSGSGLFPPGNYTRARPPLYEGVTPDAGGGASPYP